MTARDVIAGVLVVAGTGLQVLACLGVALMRDPLDRLHYLGPSSLAGLLLAAALVVQESFSLIGNKAILLALLVLVTSPVLAHVTARAIEHERRRER